MKKSIIDEVLLCISDLADFNINIRSVSRGSRYFMGDITTRKNRIWMEKVLKNKRKRQQLYSTMHYLKKQKYIKEITSANKRGYILTDKGLNKVLNLKFKNKDQKKLPGDQWLMVFFDIPEKMRGVRDKLRSQLYLMNFQCLQKSIWVTQYDVLKQVKQLLKECEIDKYVKILVVKEIME